MLSQDQKIWTVTTWISFKSFSLTLKWNKGQEHKARFCYIVCAMLCTSKSLLNKNLHQDQKSWGYEETRGTLQQYFCTDYLAGSLLCVQGAAATHLNRLSGPTPAPSSWNFQLVWAVAQIPLEGGSKALQAAGKKHIHISAGQQCMSVCHSMGAHAAPFQAQWPTE